MGRSLYLYIPALISAGKRDGPGGQAWPPSMGGISPFLAIFGADRVSASADVLRNVVLRTTEWQTRCPMDPSEIGSASQEQITREEAPKWGFAGLRGTQCGALCILSVDSGVGNSGEVLRQRHWAEMPANDSKTNPRAQLLRVLVFPSMSGHHYVVE